MRKTEYGYLKDIIVLIVIIFKIKLLQMKCTCSRI